jgi:hypothetical protein
MQTIKELLLAPLGLVNHDVSFTQNLTPQWLCSDMSYVIAVKVLGTNKE